MKARPILSFDHQRTRFSTEILNVPLSRKWWDLLGAAEFSTQGGAVKVEVTVRAYRFSGQWFFFLPNINVNEISEKINDKNRQSDFSKYLEIVVPPGCPVELIDLSVRMNPKDPLLRDARFKVRNRSKKATSRFSFEISTRGEEDSPGVGTSLEAKPGDIVDGPDNLDDLGYLFCEGEQYQRLVVDFVRFADGTEWKLRTRQGKHNGRR